MRSRVVGDAVPHTPWDILSKKKMQGIASLPAFVPHAENVWEDCDAGSCKYCEGRFGGG